METSVRMTYHDRIRHFRDEIYTHFAKIDPTLARQLARAADFAMSDVLTKADAGKLVESSVVVDAPTQIIDLRDPIMAPLYETAKSHVRSCERMGPAINVVAYISQTRDIAKARGLEAERLREALETTANRKMYSPGGELYHIYEAANGYGKPAADVFI